MNKVIKVPLSKYLKTLCAVVIHVMVIVLLANNFLPGLNKNSIFLLGILFYVFKVINYLVASIRVTDQSLTYNGLTKRGVLIHYGAIEEAEITGPSQFNSNHMLTLYSEIQSLNEKRKELGRIPIFWFSKKDMLFLLDTIQENNPRVIYQKQVHKYLRGDIWKSLLINYFIQYAILIVIFVFIIKKYS